MSTHAWNEAHDRLSGYLERRRNGRVLRVLRGVYNVGVVCGVAGMVVGCAGALWVLGRGVWGFVGRYPRLGEGHGDGVGRLVKRSFVVDEGIGEGGGEFGVQIIVRLPRL